MQVDIYRYGYRFDRITANQTIDVPEYKLSLNTVSLVTLGKTLVTRWP